MKPRASPRPPCRDRARSILLGEGVPDERILVTGNTVVDELLLQRERARLGGHDPVVNRRGRDQDPQRPSPGPGRSGARGVEGAAPRRTGGDVRQHLCGCEG